ncbi:MAG: helix-turn-helix transcriptional regulator [Lachnospiraceae bacterium]|nr:helix-turn-helix transcriptional regulator [Lachnospiraceae bacterium]
MDYSYIGMRIKKHREKRGLSQAKFAEIVNLSDDYISKIERGDRLPKLPPFIEILNALDVSADEILFEVLERSYESRIAEYVERIGNLSKKEQERIFNILDVCLRDR